MLVDAERYQYQLIERMKKNTRANEKDLDMCRYILQIIQANIVFNTMEAHKKALKEERL